MDNILLEIVDHKLLTAIGMERKECKRTGEISYISWFKKKGKKYRIMVDAYYDEEEEAEVYYYSNENQICGVKGGTGYKNVQLFQLMDLLEPLQIHHYPEAYVGFLESILASLSKENKAQGVLISTLIETAIGRHN